MTKKHIIKQPKEHVISIRLSNHLNELLTAKAKELGVDNMSEAIRLLLASVLESPQPDKSLQYTLMTYSLIQETLLSLVEDAEGIVDRASKKAENLTKALSKN